MFKFFQKNSNHRKIISKAPRRGLGASINLFFWRKLSARGKLYFWTGMVAFFLILIPSAFYIYNQTRKVEAAWFNDSWGYRQSFSVSNSGAALGTFQIPIATDSASLITAGKMRSDCNDIRATDFNGKILRHWVQNCNSITTTIWVTASSVPTSGTTIFVYYGNPGAVSSKIPQGTQLYPGLSCRTILESGNSSGDGTYWIDTTNGDNSDKQQAYCDMTANSGGWMLVKPNMVDSVYATYSSQTLSTDVNGGVAYNFVSTGTGCGNGQDPRATVLITNNIQWDIVRSKKTLGPAGSSSCWGVDNGGGYTVSSNLQLFNISNDILQNCVLTCSTSPYVMPPMNRCDNAAENFARFNTANSRSFEQTGRRTNRTTNSGPAVGLSCNTMGLNWVIDNIYIKENLHTYSQLTVSGKPEEKGTGPVAYWKFDEGYGTATKDAASKNHNASLASGTSWATENMCVSGKCLKFDGVDDYVSMGTGANYFPMNTFSICSWIKTPGLASGMTTNGIISLTYGLSMSLDSSGRLWSYLDNGTSMISILATGNLADNKWHYVCTTYDGTYQRLYSDGIEKISAARTWSGTTRWPTNGVNVGHENNNPPIQKFNGYIDDVKIYNYYRTAAQIKTDYASRGSIKGTSSSIGNDLVRQGSLANGLVGYWKMDESSGAGSSLADSSGNSNNGTAVLWGGGNTATDSAHISGKYGNSFSFDGGDDNAQITNASSGLKLISSDATFSVWVKPNTIAGYDGIVGNNFTNGWWFTLNAGKASVWVATAGVVYTGNTTLAAGQWSNILVSYKSSTKTATFYVNGVLDGTAITASAIGDGGTTFYIGNDGRDGSGYAFDGLIDELRVYNRALSPAEVSKLYSYAPGPVGYYNFEEGQGSSANDKSGNGYTGTITGSIWSSGKYGKGGKFNGSNDSIDLGTNFTANTSNLTVSAWVKGNSPSANTAIFSKGVWGAGRATGYGLLAATSGNNKFDFEIGGTVVQSTKSIDSNWHYVTGVRNGTTLQIYVDGVLENTQTVSVVDLTYSSTANIGQRGASVGYFKGSVDEVRIYNYARTPGQIVEDMNAGHPIGGSPVASQQLHLKLDEGYGSTSKSQVNGYIFDHFNSPTWISDGKFGKAIDFDGLNDHLRSDSSNPFEYRGEDYTISTWFYPHDGDTDGGWIISKPWNGSGQYNYTLQLISNKTITFSLVGATSWSGTTTKTLSTNSWHHVAATIENSTKNVKIYFDGKQVYSGTHTITDWTPSSGDTNVRLSIGCLYPYGTWAGVTSHCVKGKIDEVKIYNTPLTADQIKLDYNQGKALVLGSFGTDSDGKTASNSASRVYCVSGDTSSCNPPVAEWNFEEKQGVAANDTSGNGSTLNLSSTTWGQGKSGSAILYNGSTSTASVSDNPSISLSNTGTIEAWVYSNRIYPSDDGSTMFRNIANKWTSGSCSGADEGYFFDWNGTNVSGTLRGFICNGTSSQGISYATALSRNKWQHLVYVWDGSYHRLYMNGRQVGTPVAQTINNQDDTASLRIGDGFGGGASYRWDGRLDQVKIYNYARTPAQIAWDYNQGKPIGWWKFDECQGGNANDSSGNGNTGTITIGGTGTQTSVGTCQTASTAWYNGATGKYNSSLNLDGTDDKILVSDNPVLDGFTQMSVFFWAKPSVSTTKEMIIKHLSTTSDINWELYQAGSNIAGRVVGSNVTCTSTGSLFSTNNWHFVGMTWDGTNVKVYVDGKLSNTCTDTDTMTNSIGNLSIGSYESGSYAFQGQIDDVRIYNYALTPVQVKNVMNQGAAVRWGPLTGSP